MLASDGQIRLTAGERKQLAGITGMDASHIKSRDQLNEFIHTQIEKLPRHDPGACLAKRLLLTFVPSGTGEPAVHCEDEP
jgi:hypothetical protein